MYPSIPMPTAAPVSAILLTALLCLSPGAFAKPYWEQEWSEIRTPNFIIVSALDQKKSLKLAQELESFRSVVGVFTNISNVPERVPTHIYLFPSRAPEVGLGEKADGYFMGHMRGNFMPMYFRYYRQALVILQHEYAHFLTYNHSAHDYPAWFTEGFAEVLSTVEVDGDKAEYGKPPENRIKWLAGASWENFSWILEPTKLRERSGRKVAMFYAQSWALAHYLMLGRKGHDFRKEMSLYMELIASGRATDDAFLEAFGEPVRDLKRNVLGYLKGGIPYVRLTLNNAYPVSEMWTRTLAGDEVAARIGILCILNGKNKEAQKYLEAALKLNADNGDALVGMADLHKFEKRFEQAIPLYERAIAVEPDNAMHELDYGEYYLDRAKEEQDPAALKQWVELARQHLGRSLQLDEGNPEAMTMLGATYLAQGESAHVAVDKLLLASEKLPANFDIKMYLALAYVSAGMPEMAIPIARRIHRMTHGGKSGAAARLLAEIDPGFAQEQEEED